VDVTARYSADTGCTRTENDLFTAPARCAAGNPPDCSDARPSKRFLVPANHRFRTVRIRGVTDPDGGEIDITINSVTSDEPVDGRGDGNTCPDARINSDGTVELRAERSARGNGRVYTINFTATDDTGASCEGSVFVCVPKNARDDDDRGRRRGDDDDDDDDDDDLVGPKTGDILADGRGGRGGRDDDDCDDDDFRGPNSGDVIADGRRDRGRGGRRGDDDCRRCRRGEEQFDPTVCEAGKVGLSDATEATTEPLVTRANGDHVAILFTNATAGPVDVRIFDLRGRLVRQLTAQDFPAGRHALHWDGLDANGHRTASGIYLVRAVMGETSHTSKTVWVR
jgi:hypothetical protein